MTAKELIKAYNIKLTVKWDGTKYAPTGTLMITDGVACRRAGDLDAVKAAKPEILAVLMAEREAEERADQEHQEKINSIPGLAEIKAARKDLAKWNQEFQASFESECGGGVGVRPKPQYDLAALYAKYPRAKAYLLADQYANSENYAKAKAGEKAVRAIMNGEDPEATIAAMEAEWKEYTQAHMWN